MAALLSKLKMECPLFSIITFLIKSFDASVDFHGFSPLYSIFLKSGRGALSLSVYLN